MPEPVTMPEPAPPLDTLSVKTGTKVAVTERACDIVTVHDPVPLQAPDQPVKREPVAASAVSVTFVPSSSLSLQSEPQSMPEPVTVPAPLFVTVSKNVRTKVAVTERA